MRIQQRRKSRGCILKRRFKRSAPIPSHLSRVLDFPSFFPSVFDFARACRQDLCSDSLYTTLFRLACNFSSQRITASTTVFSTQDLHIIPIRTTTLELHYVLDNLDTSLLMVDMSQETTSTGAGGPVQASPEDSSAQSTQECSQHSIKSDPDIWGSLIPLNSKNTHIFQIDFRKGVNRYVVGRGGHSWVDFPFVNMLSMSESLIYLSTHPTNQCRHVRLSDR